MLLIAGVRSGDLVELPSWLACDAIVTLVASWKVNTGSIGFEL
jgi:hypothetical protein